MVPSSKRTTTSSKAKAATATASARSKATSKIKVFKNFSEILTLKKAYLKDGRKLLPEDTSLLKDGCIVCDDQKILWVGVTSRLPKDYQRIPAKRTFDMRGLCATPALVDSHTHLIFGGDRSEEYIMRLNGATYETIAAAGGGILDTVKKTNLLSSKELIKLAQKRIKKMAALGVGTIEIKSGYGLNISKEKEYSEVIAVLKDQFAGEVTLVNTFMAAHAIGPGFKSSSQYMHEVVLPLLKDIGPKGIVDCVDIFHEQGYFTQKDSEALFQLAQQFGLKCKIHADEFNDNGGAELATQYQCLSADHLLSSGEQGLKALAQSSVVATLLPGTGLFLGKAPAKGRVLQDLGAKVAIATDYNPGSCHFDNLLLLASIMAPNPNYRFNQAELWSAITLNGAAALGLRDRGAIVEGLAPMVAVFKTDSIAKLTYHWGNNFFAQFLSEY